MFPLKGLIPQIGTDMASQLIQNKVDNPYLKTFLAPLVNLFTGGILNGLMPSQIAGTMANEKFPENFDVQGNAKPNANPAALKLRDELTPVVEKLVLDISQTEQGEFVAREGKV